MRQFTETNYKLLLGMVRMALTSTKFDYSVSRTDGESIEFSDPCTGIRGIFEVDADKSFYSISITEKVIDGVDEMTITNFEKIYFPEEKHDFMWYDSESETVEFGFYLEPDDTTTSINSIMCFILNAVQIVERFRWLLLTHSMLNKIQKA